MTLTTSPARTGVPASAYSAFTAARTDFGSESPAAASTPATVDGPSTSTVISRLPARSATNPNNLTLTFTEAGV